MFRFFPAQCVHSGAKPAPASDFVASLQELIVLFMNELHFFFHLMGLAPERHSFSDTDIVSLISMLRLTWHWCRANHWAKAVSFVRNTHEIESGGGAVSRPHLFIEWTVFYCFSGNYSMSGSRCLSSVRYAAFYWRKYCSRVSLCDCWQTFMSTTVKLSAQV